MLNVNYYPFMQNGLISVNYHPSDGVDRVKE